MDETVYGKGSKGDLNDYVPTGEHLQIQVVYGYWVHSNYGAHLSAGKANGEGWYKMWKTLAVMSVRSYNALIGRVGQKFVWVMAIELTGFQQRRWNTEIFIISRR